MFPKGHGRLAPGLAPLHIPGETLLSYASRLEARLGMDPGYLWSAARVQERRITTGNITREAIGARLSAMCDRMTGLSAGTFLPAALQQIAWHACRECTGGLMVQLESGDGRLVCQEQKRWTGPSVVNKGTPPGCPPPSDGYHSRRVSDEVLGADVRLENLIRSCKANQRLLDEVWARIVSARRRLYRGVPAPSDLPMAAALLSVLTDPDLDRRLFDPAITFKQAYVILTESICSELPKADWAMIDQAWLLLRPTFVWFRTTKLGEKPIEHFDPLIMPLIDRQDALYPLEPMGRYLGCLHTRDRVDNQWWSDRFVVPQADPKATESLICGNGHVHNGQRGKARRADHADFHCSICSGQRVVAGYNSLADLMPALALEWDQEANGNLTPYMISPGSNKKVGWKDSLGHHYDAHVVNRTRHGTGCGYCASKAVLAGFNDLAHTHPDLAALWDYEANGDLKPTAVSAGNADTKVNLRCPYGHQFTRTPAKLVETNGRCQKCCGKVLISGTNDLATRRPDVAAWWHPTRNGTLMPNQLKPGSETKVHWLCPDGHEFDTTPAYLCGQKKLTCPVDTGRLLVSGVNDLATKEPALVMDWDYERNGFGPHDVVPGAGPYIWTCKYGHTQPSSVGNRRRAGGCTMCLPEERVASGQRKNTRGRNGWEKRKQP